MAKYAFVQISWRKNHEIMVRWDVEHDFFFPVIKGRYAADRSWFYSGNTEMGGPHRDTDDPEVLMSLFKISHQKGDLIFKTCYSHEITQDGIGVIIDGASDYYHVKFGFVND